MSTNHLYDVFVPNLVIVVNKIDAARRNFLWEDNSDKKIHLVKWSNLRPMFSKVILGQFLEWGVSKTLRGANERHKSIGPMP